MNYADFGIGTFQPPNGFHDLVNAMVDLGKSLGVKYEVNHKLSKINVKNKKIENLIINDKSIDCDLILSGADYHHTESLLPIKSRNKN